MTKKTLSSTWSLINGDHDLSFVQIIIYHLLLRLENLLSIGGMIKGAKFYLPKSVIRHDDTSSSPSRQLCWDFLHSLDFKTFVEQDSSLNVLDIGCGRGHYSHYFQEQGPTNYLGVDAVENKVWEEITDDRTKFVKCNCGVETLPIPQSTNVIFSQSSLEHIQYDLTLFHDIAEYVNQQKHTIIQIHLLPYRKSINVYGTHGHRVYNQQAINKILELFPSAESEIYLFGNESLRNLFYEKYADNRFLSVLMSSFKKEKESKTLQSSEIQPDAAMSKSQTDADFVALVIGHNIKNLNASILKNV